jgi:hypothetical protein
MFIIANHNIQDPDAFWSIVKKEAANIPPNIKLRAMFPSTNPLRNVCLWEAESIGEVNKFLRQTFGEISKDELFEVNQEVAIGLPVAEKAGSL